MKIALVALTKKGSILGADIATKLGARLYIKEEHAHDSWEYTSIEGNFGQFVGGLFKNYNAIVFIMACGIVVRAIAPFLLDKRKDPGVVVVDEKGKYCISLLSGHVGGGNELANRVAQITGGEAIITTATDINGVFAFDMFAKKNNCSLENNHNLKLVSSALLHAKKVNFYSEYMISGEIPQNVLYKYESNIENLDTEVGGQLTVVLSNKEFENLKSEDILIIRPKNIILGIGCRKGVDKEEIKAAILDFFNKEKISMNSIKQVASAQIKKDETGIIEFCKEFELPFVTVAMERIKEVEGEYSSSSFVKEKVGVAGVCEAASVLSGNNASLIKNKTVYKGITLAIAQEGGGFSI